MLGKLFRRSQSEWHYFKFIYGTESKLIWAVIIFILGLGVGSLPERLGQALAQYSVITGALALLAGIYQTFRKWKNITIIPRVVPAHISDKTQLQWQADEPQIFKTCAHPDKQETLIWFDKSVNNYLISQSLSKGSLIGRVSNHPFELPLRLRSIAPLALRKRNSRSREIVTRKAPRPIRFNGKLLRLNSEPTIAQLSSGELDFSLVSYFDGECSNEIWNYADRENNSIGLVDEFVLTRDHKIRLLEHSQVANIVGISIIAITADSKVIFVRQSAGNSVAPGSLAASGSGSLELRDLKSLVKNNETNFDAKDLLMKGMLREMCEESLIREHEILYETFKLTGYFRWIARGCKPEFTGLVHVGVTADELKSRKHRGEESAFSKKLIFVPLNALFEAAHLVQLSSSESTGESINYWQIGMNALIQSLGEELNWGLSPSAEAAWVFSINSVYLDNIKS